MSYAEDASLALQGASVAALKAANAVRALVGNPAAVFDAVPQGAKPPYISLGAEQAQDAGDGCHRGAELFVQFDCWSRAVGRVEAKRMAAAVVATLDAEFTVPGHEIVVHELEGITFQLGLDGLTTQAAVRLRFELAPTT